MENLTELNQQEQIDREDIFYEFAEEFYPDDQHVRFVIDSDTKAEWAIRKIAAEEAECDRLFNVCQAEIDRYKARQEAYVNRRENRTAGLRSMLQEYFGTVPVKETKTQQKYELPSGSLVLKKASSDFKPDTEKLRDWLMSSGMTDYLKTEISPRWALVKKQLITTKDGEIVFAETGEIMPDGLVVIEEKPSKFEVKAK